jgi:multidrug efflux pump
LNLSAPFIRRPVATSLLAFGLLLAGILAYMSLPVASLPKVDFPTLSVSAQLPGASSLTMASSVATPLERRFGRIAGLTEMTSTSVLGSTSITLQFDLDRNVDAAARDVQAAIAAAAGELPPNLPVRPTYRKVNPSDAPILILALTSEALPLSAVFDAANTVLAQKIAQVPGVGQVTVAGGQQPAVRVQYDPAAIAGMGVGSANLRATIAASTVDEAKGTIAGEVQSSSIGANDQVFDANGYRSLVVAHQGSSATTLGDVAHVYDSVENERVAGWADTKPAVLLMVRKQPDANILETNQRILSLLPELKQSIPGAIDVQVNSNRTQTIRASVNDVARTLGISMVLVVLIVFGFLRSGRATLVPAVAMPLSLAGTFAAMWLLGYSIDNLSLMALTISTGFVVDDAIVVTENVVRALERGVPRREAALEGTKQIGFTIVSITVSLLAVFVPILLMGGIVGRLFREFAVTLSLAVGISALVSLTLTPMMCSRLLRLETNPSRNWAFRATESAFDTLLASYERALRWVLRHRTATLLITLATIALNVALFVHVPKGLFPQQDNGLLMASTEAGQDVSFAEMKRLQTLVNGVIAADPDVDHFVSFIGSGGLGTSNTGSAFITLKPLPPRTTSADRVLARLREKLAHVPGVTTYLQARQDVNVSGALSRTQYQYTLQDANLDELGQWAPKVLDAFRKLPELKDVNSDQQSAGQRLNVVVDRDTASRLGVSMQAVDGALYDAYGQRFAATTFTEQNEYHVVLEAAPQARATPDSLDGIYVQSASGDAVPLRAIARVSAVSTTLSVSHRGQFPSVTLSFNLAPNASLGSAVDAIDRATQAMHLPASVHGEFQGSAKAFTASLRSEPLLVAAALLTVYIVLGVLYESYLHPLTILSTLPSAGIGALVALLLFGVDLSIIAIVGLLLLIGIVKKNAILLIDFAVDAERNQGASPELAIVRACSLRFRPILMTTFAALFGALPLAFGSGLGSELRRPLGITIVGGLLASQLLTLFTTPVVYLALESLRERAARFFSHGRGVEPSPGIGTAG